MKNSLGTSVILTVFGESHGPAVGVVLDGLAPGLPVDEAYIAEQLSRRRPAGPADTARVEPDRFQLVSGVYRGRTTGTPLTILIPNENVRSKDYDTVQTVARPAHADYTAECKYHGWQDPRGGGHFSGRVTAGIVAAGAICRQALEARGIRLGTHILRCAGVEDAPFTDVASEIAGIEAKRFPLICAKKNPPMNRHSVTRDNLNRSRIGTSKNESQRILWYRSSNCALASSPMISRF